MSAKSVMFGILGAVGVLAAIVVFILVLAIAIPNFTQARKAAQKEAEKDRVTQPAR